MAERRYVIAYSLVRKGNRRQQTANEGVSGWFTNGEACSTPRTEGGILYPLHDLLQGDFWVRRQINRRIFYPLF